ncbi:MAG TPA: MATE family efflux transporter [Gammaproteobacteria bacterium]|nr:MATE family efflux transporter [Gammaproteobacteria bacterium]
MRYTEIKKITRQIISFAVPLQLGSMFVVFTALINTKILGKNQMDLYLFAIFAPISYFIIAFQESFRAVATGIAATYRTAPNVRSLFICLLLTAAIFGLLFYGIFLEFKNNIISFLQVNPKFSIKFQQFCEQMIFVNVLLITLSIILNSFITGLGFKKTGLLFSLTASLLTSSFLYFGIVYLKEDIHALVISLQLTGVILCSSIFYFLLKQTIFQIKFIKITKADFCIILGSIKKIYVPIFTSYLTIFGGLIAYNSILADYGNDVLSGYFVGYRLQALVILPAISIGSAMAILVNHEKANKAKNFLTITYIGIILSLIFYILIGECIYYFRHELINYLVSSAEIKKSADHYLQYVSRTDWLFGPMLVFLTMLEQTGYGLYVLIANILYVGLVASIGKYFSVTHHNYISFYQTIFYANCIFPLLIFSSFWFFKRIKHNRRNLCLFQQI